MNLDMYIQKIETIANRLVKDNEINEIRTPMEPYYFDEKLLNEFLEMINVKKQIVTSNELWQSDMFSNEKIDSLNVDPEIKILLTSIYLEVWEKAMEIRFLRSMERYNRSDPIFANNNLYDYVRHGNELIDFTILNWDKTSYYCKYEDRYLKPSCFLNEEVIEFAKSMFPFDKKFIRLDAYYSSEERPLIILQEEALRPINPNWINTLRLFKGQSTGGHYILQEPIFSSCTIPSELQRLRWWEHNIKGIRSLEIHAQRNNHGNLSMMLEEINVKPICKRYYISKCIHLDSDDKIGTNFDDSILNHIDLAINVYSEDAFLKRRSQSLADGRVVDATLRTHLLRLDGVSLRMLVNLSILFFDSQVLTGEWISDQFR